MDISIFRGQGRGQTERDRYEETVHNQRPMVPSIYQKMDRMPEPIITKLSVIDRFRVWMINEGAPVYFIIVFAILHVLVYVFGFLNYKLKDTMVGANTVFGFTYPVARAAALTLHVDVAFLLFPVCRTLISYARQTHLNGVIQFDENLQLHKLIGWSIFVFSWVHTFAHWNNFAQLALKNKLGFKGFILINVTAGPAWTGYIMLVVLNLIVFTSIERFRKSNFERFWYTHHLFIVFFIFWSFHGTFCMIKTDFAPFCAGIGVFWKYWLLGGTAYLGERIAREVRGRHKTQIKKVLQHPNNVVEIQFAKAHTTTRAGQYIFLCCPAVSIWQYHPFTLTSSPEEGFLSVHIRCKGDFTTQLSKILGCKFSAEKKAAPKVLGQELYVDDDKTPSATNRILPRIYIDGPFGSASEDVFKYDVAILVGAGIGVTPFASILKSVWFRMNYSPQGSRLKKFYFVWSFPDFCSFEWFSNLLKAIESQDKDEKIELLIHTTNKVDVQMMSKIADRSLEPEDPVTKLWTRTNYGRPQVDKLFAAVKSIHSPGQAGVFFCGPPSLGVTLHTACNRHSDRNFGFVWGKENF